MRFIFRFAVTALLIYLLIRLHYLSGVALTDGTNSLLIFTFILGLVNLIVGGVLRLITLPIRFFSLGIIGFLISIIVVRFTDSFVTGVSLEGWVPVLVIALIMGLVSTLFA